MLRTLKSKTRSRRIILTVAIILFALAFQNVRAATNISADPAEHWAWNDVIGWINFFDTNTVEVFSNRLEGYASSPVGDISLNCNSTRSGNICGIINYSVTNDGTGNLSGWGWNDQYGWVSFNCDNNGGCGASNYLVYIDAIAGQFHGFAWNDIIGWISFNCAEPAICGVSNYKVVTSWTVSAASATLDSSTFDTGTGGVQLNSVIWFGDQPVSTSVGFQFATSDSSLGPWNFIGSDGTSNTYYTIGPGVSKRLDYNLHNGKRYFRYQITLFSNPAQTQSPRVDDVYINWSP